MRLITKKIPIWRFTSECSCFWIFLLNCCDILTNLSFQMYIIKYSVYNVLFATGCQEKVLYDSSGLMLYVEKTSIRSRGILKQNIFIFVRNIFFPQISSCRLLVATIGWNVMLVPVYLSHFPLTCNQYVIIFMKNESTNYSKTISLVNKTLSNIEQLHMCHENFKFVFAIKNYISCKYMLQKYPRLRHTVTSQKANQRKITVFSTSTSCEAIDSDNHNGESVMNMASSVASVQLDHGYSPTDPQIWKRKVLWHNNHTKTTKQQTLQIMPTIVT